jgi:hypothetical protein
MYTKYATDAANDSTDTLYGTELIYEAEYCSVCHTHGD